MSNINQTIEENTSLFKNFSQKSFEIQNKLIENQTKSIQLLEQMLSKSEKSESINVFFFHWKIKKNYKSPFKIKALKL